MAATKLLVVTRHSPLPGNDGAGAYLFDLLSYLARKGVRIEVVWIKAEEEFLQRGHWRVPTRVNAVAKIRVVGSLAIGRYRFFWWGPLKARFLGNLKAVLRALHLYRRSTPNPARTGSRPPIPTRSGNVEPEWSELPSVNETRFFRDRLRSFRPDAVMANYCWLLPILPRDASAQKFVLTHDVASQRLNLKGHGSSIHAGDYSPASMEGETRLLEMADVILAISEDDAAAFRAMTPKRTVLVTPKAANIRPSTLATTSGRCLFVGGINPPNQEGLSWFLEYIWPIVHAARPDATLHICGAIGRTVSKVPAGVTVLGRIESLDTEYAAAQVVVVPLLQGTGVKIKFVEACSHGKACVTTPIGLQGLSFLRSGVIESSEAQDFAQGVLRILSDAQLRTALEGKVLTLVNSHLSPDRCYGAVRDVMRRATPAFTPSRPDPVPAVDADRPSLQGEKV